MSSFHEENSENSKSSHGEIGEQTDQVEIINLKKKTCRHASINEILNPILLKLVNEDYIFLILDASAEAIVNIRRAYGLHPILDYECLNQNRFSIDHMFHFESCLFLSLIDIPNNEDLTNPASVKILLMKNIMFIIISEPLQCITEIFRNSMNFKIFESTKKAELCDPVMRSSDIMRQIRRSRLSVMKSVDESIGLGDLESVLYKIIHLMYIRIEEYVDALDKEVINCIELVMNLSITENTDIIVRMNQALYKMSISKIYVNKKGKILPQLIKTHMLSKTFSEYLISMSLNMQKLEKKISSRKDLLKSYGYVYNSIIDDDLTQSSTKFNKLLQVFSAIAAIFLPLNLIAAYMGMNIRVPYQGDMYNTLWPFSIIIIISACYFFFIIVLFKLKGWL